MPDETLPQGKTCSKCGETKPLEEFPKSKRNRGGRWGMCKVCQAARAKAWREAHPERARELERARARDPVLKAANEKRYRGRNPEKLQARRAVNNAIRDGRLIKPDRCEDCGGPGQLSADGRSPIQAHHHDYSKPLEVEWVCRDCHWRHHGKQQRLA